MVSMKRPLGVERINRKRQVFLLSSYLALPVKVEGRGRRVKQYIRRQKKSIALFYNTPTTDFQKEMGLGRVVKSTTFFAG
jgi:hypothetical protein